MLKPIRILHMIGSLEIGGSQAMVLNLYKSIDRNKVQFDFIIDHPEQRALVSEVKELGAIVYKMPTFTGKNIVEVCKAWSSFFKLHPEYKILHSHVRSYASIYLPIAHKYNIKTIIHSHSTSNGSGISAYIKAIMQYPLRFQADYYFGCSKEAGEWLFGKKVVASNKYHMLQNSIDLEKYKINRVIREKYRLELGLDNRRTFIHVGRFHPAKNHIFLLDMFAEWLKKNQDDILLIIGDGDLRLSIERKIKLLKIVDSVKMLGIRKDVPNLLQAADCFLFPSKWEGLPVTIVEAQAAGLPSLISANVTNDVFISQLAIKLPIDNGIKCWIEKMSELDYRRVDVTDDIKRAGFDIVSTVEWLTDSYMKLYNDCVL